MKTRIFFSLLVLLSNLSFSQIRFAAIGDYGSGNSNEAAVSDLIDSWNVDFVITLGDNNYDNGSETTIDDNIGKDYNQWIYPYYGTYAPGGSQDSLNHFFPTLGNHDWMTPNAQPYLDFFTLPGNERYYDFVIGNVHFFMLDSDEHEPDSASFTSVQGQWFQNVIEGSSAQWKLVCFHHPPFSSGSIHGSTFYMQWPFKDSGANAVLSGHDHDYERLIANGLVYFVNGLGGKSREAFGQPLPESIVRFRDAYGAMLIEANTDSINFKFITVNNDTIDNYSIYDLIPVELSSFSANYSNNSVHLFWTTETEINIRGFYVERRTEFSKWEKIKFISGHGTTTKPNSYNFDDKSIIKNITYKYHLKLIDFSGSFDYSEIVSVKVGRPDKFNLNQNYPNPFNATTRIDFTIPENQTIKLTIYNSLGEEVSELINEKKESGYYSIMFDASNLSSGIYFYKLSTPLFSAVKKMILIK